MTKNKKFYVGTWYIVMCLWNTVESSLSLGGSISYGEKCLDFVCHPLYEFKLLHTCFGVLNLFMSGTQVFEDEVGLRYVAYSCTMSMLGHCRVNLQYQSDCDVSPVSWVVGLCSSSVYLDRIRGHRVAHQGIQNHDGVFQGRQLGVLLVFQTHTLMVLYFVT